MKHKHLIIGGTGHIGSELSKRLLAAGESVIVIGHDPKKATGWAERGAQYETVDLIDPADLGRLLTQGDRLFIVNPPAPPDTDTVYEETKTTNGILTAIKAHGHHLQKIVAASTYGAQPGDHIGDLGVLYNLEQGLTTLAIPTAVIRSAYYMSNWDQFIESAQKTGALPTLYPADFRLPMVAPGDIAGLAADLMMNEELGLHFIEGPNWYSPNDVAAAIGKVLNKTISVSTIPEEKWKASLQQNGFSDPAAEYMVNMTKLTLEGRFDTKNVILGHTDLNTYFAKQHGETND